MFLVLYYAVLVERNPQKITFVEVMLYIWIAAFAYDELGEFRDAGTLFYATDFWSIWDIAIVGIGIAYLVSSTSLVFHIPTQSLFSATAMICSEGFL